MYIKKHGRESLYQVLGKKTCNMKTQVTIYVNINFTQEKQNGFNINPNKQRLNTIQVIKEINIPLTQ